MNLKEQIKEAIYLINLEIDKELKLYLEKIKALNAIARVTRSMCDHSETQYYPDASGNNDSYHVCLICGLERKRFK